MRIGVSLLNWRIGCMGGIETLLRKLVEHLDTLSGNDEVWFLVNRANCGVLPEHAHSYLFDWSQAQTTGFRLMEAFTPWRARMLEKAIHELNLDVMLYPHQAMFPKQASVPSLLTVVDMQHLFIPKYFSRFDLEFRKRAYVSSLEQCSRIMAISEVTADSLVRKCKVPRSKIDVIHLGCDRIAMEKVIDQQFLKEPYLYYPAASFPHKGHKELFRSFARLKHSGRLSSKLVLTGMRTAYWKKLEKVIAAEGMSDEIIHLGYVSYAEVMSLYKGASAVLFPSEFEGFGIPIIEAVQFNKKVICSQLEVFDEIGVPKQWQIDYRNPDALAEALDSYGTTQLLSAPSTWGDTVYKVLALLKETAIKTSAEAQENNEQAKVGLY